MSETEQTKTELELLQEQATIMGITFSKKAGVAALKEKIAAKMNGESIEDDEVEVEQTPTKQTLTKAETEAKQRKEIYNEAMKLVRIHVSCMNPAMSEVPGAIFAVANEYIGNVRKYVPFTGHDDGWHVPNCIYQLLLSKQFTTTRTQRDPITKREVQVPVTLKEFNIQVLPQLTEEELELMKKAQLAAKLK